MYNFDTLSKQIGEVDHLVERWIEQLGLNYNGFAVLYSLAAGLCTQKQISEEWYLPKQTVFNICKEYKEKGWITFSPSKTDKRERIIQLTAEGKAQAEPIFQATQTVTQRTFNAFGGKKSAQLFGLLTEFCQAYRQEMDRSLTKE